MVLSGCSIAPRQPHIVSEDLAGRETCYSDGPHRIVCFSRPYDRNATKQTLTGNQSRRSY